MATPVRLVTPPPFESKEMSVSEWITVPDNPRQRDTERHLRKAKHLLTPQPTHSRVSMAMDPKGNRWKLDGHTRSLAWQRQMVTPPTVLLVDIYKVRDKDAAANLYKLFDNKDAVETAADQVTGAYRETGFIPVSKLLSRNVLANAVRFADGLARGNRRATAPSEADVYTIIASWLDELKKLDAMHVKPQRFPGPIVTASLMTFRKHGDSAREFWRLYSEDAGEKISGGMDPVEALSRFMLENRVVGGPIEMVGKALAAFEAWREAKTVTRALIALDPSRYMIRAKRS